MAVKVRMSRTGGKNEPSFRIVATDSRSPRDGRNIEVLGWYDPKREGVTFSFKRDRIDYWKGQGAIFSETVASLVRRDNRAAAAKPA